MYRSTAHRTTARVIAVVTALFAAAALTITMTPGAQAGPAWKTATEALEPISVATDASSEDATGDTTQTTIAQATTAADPDPVPFLDGSPASVTYAISSSVGRAWWLTGDGIQIALIDTGVTDVPGLQSSNITIGPDFSFDAMNPDLIGRDAYGHGTHLAGIMVGADPDWVAGDHNRAATRFLGIAPSAELISVKVGAANGAVDVTQVIAAINWIIDSNAAGDTNVRVLTLAYGTNSDQDYRVDPLAFAVERAWHAGIVVVVAAGNDGDVDAPLANPALDPYVIAVGAADTGAKRNRATTANFSNTGTRERGVDVVAPGRSIVSLRVPGSFSDQFNEAGRVGDEYVKASGTSQAAAVTAAAVALILDDDPSLRPDQVKQLLIETATSGAADEAGLINVDSAIKSSPPKAKQALQSFPRSDGSGSIEASRGTVHVSLDGVALTGEQDIFGNNFSGLSWTGSTWSGLSWTGLSWNGLSWTGLSWTGLSWTGLSWTGLSWTGLSWNGLSWTGLSWNGLSWTGLSWNGLSWTGLSWTGLSWNSLLPACAETFCVGV